MSYSPIASQQSNIWTLGGTASDVADAVNTDDDDTKFLEAPRYGANFVAVLTSAPASLASLRISFKIKEVHTDDPILASSTMQFYVTDALGNVFEGTPVDITTVTGTYAQFVSDVVLSGTPYDTGGTPGAIKCIVHYGVGNDWFGGSVHLSLLTVTDAAIEHAGNATVTFTGVHGTNVFNRAHSGAATSTFTGHGSEVDNVGHVGAATFTMTALGARVYSDERPGIITSYSMRGGFSSGMDREDFAGAKKRLIDTASRDYKDEVHGA
jgi:hypothetical protein